MDSLSSVKNSSSASSAFPSGPNISVHQRPAAAGASTGALHIFMIEDGGFVFSKFFEDTVT